ncbi:MAG: YbaN family protein [Myxococcota bacterium]
MASGLAFFDHLTPKWVRVDMDVSTSSPAPSRTQAPVVRGIYVAGGFALLGLAVLGAMLPGLPTTVFVILAAGCFSRSSPRLEQWLLDHPRFGPSLRAWRARGAIPRRAKILAVASMTLSGVFTALTAPWFVGVGVAAIMVASAAYVITRPDA